MGSRGILNGNGPKGRNSPTKNDRLSPIKNDRLSPTKNDRLSPTKFDRLSPVKNGRLSPLTNENEIHKSSSVPSMGTPGSELRMDGFNGASRVSLRSEDATRVKKFNNDYSKGKFTGRSTLKNPFG